MKGWETTSGGGAKRSDLPTWASLGQERSLSREDAVMTTRVTRPRLASLQTLCKRTGRHQATQDRTRHHEARSRVGLGSTREHQMTQDDTTVPELQNRWGDESPPAGSIPVRLRCEIRALTSVVAQEWDRQSGPLEGLPPARKPGDPHQSLRLDQSSLASPLSELDKSSRGRAERWTSLWCPRTPGRFPKPVSEVRFLRGT